jgi:small subunit ribosomal protein S1
LSKKQIETQNMAENENHAEMAPEMEANQEQINEQPVAEITPEIVESDEIAPAIEESAEITPAIEESAEITPEVAESEEIAPEVAESEEIIPEIAENNEVTPEVTSEPKARQFNNPVENVYGSLENFDWNALDNKKGMKYNATEQKRWEDLYTQSLKSIENQVVVIGKVVSVNSREVVVNIGSKSDGVIAASEVRYTEVKPGDPIEVYVESQEDSFGQLLLSHKKARMLKSWQRVNEAYDNQEIINGYVKCRTKGGLIVDVFGIEAFLPGSQIDVKPIRDYDLFVDKTMEFKVVKINHEYKNVVVSHKALIEDELELQKAEIIASLEKGQILEGTVKNITNYGVFIDLGGVDGLIHITDLSWGRIIHPEEIVQLDQKINVVILDFDENKKRIALGLKQLTQHPWDSLSAELAVGDKVKGKVVVIADYGAFLEIMPGVEGLIHVSEMSWSQHLRTAYDFMKVDDEVDAVILTLDREERKMSLGIKQLIPDPWINIAQKYPVDSKHTAIVRNFTNFGIFVELEEGVDGLVHISDLSWSKKIKHPAEFTKIGEAIEVVVLEVDVENRRLSLGHKQLEENPWDVFETVFTLGSVHEGTVLAQNEKGFTIALPYGIEGFCFNRGIQKENKTNIKVDEKLPFKVVEFSKEAKKVILSHSKTWQDNREDDDKRTSEGKKNAKEIAKINDNVEKTTLGDLNVLQSLKEDLEKAKEQE